MESKTKETSAGASRLRGYKQTTHLPRTHVQRQGHRYKRLSLARRPVLCGRTEFKSKMKCTRVHAITMKDLKERMKINCKGSAMKNTKKRSVKCLLSDAGLNNVDALLKNLKHLTMYSFFAYRSLERFSTRNIRRNRVAR